jgi:uncharacterized membrane protein
MLNVEAGTILHIVGRGGCRQGDTMQGPPASRVQHSGVAGVAMVAKLLLLIALLAPILTVAAGILAHRRKEPERKSPEDDST